MVASNDWMVRATSCRRLRWWPKHDFIAEGPVFEAFCDRHGLAQAQAMKPDKNG